MKKEKVFCKDCRHFYNYVLFHYLNGKETEGECEHYSCFVTKEIITAYSQETKRKRITDYDKKNKKNDCLHYEKKIIKEKPIKKSFFKKLFGGLNDNK